LPQFEQDRRIIAEFHRNFSLNFTGLQPREQRVQRSVLHEFHQGILKPRISRTIKVHLLLLVFLERRAVAEAGYGAGARSSKSEGANQRKEALEESRR
jgi:hypothetical protein